MKFSIGYQLPDEYDSIAEICKDYKDHISSVYFSAPEQISARSVIAGENRTDMLRELRYVRDLGIKLTLLYNANCYGDEAVSSRFKEKIVENIHAMRDAVNITDITTTSPFVAKTVKETFPELKVCASINMWVGTTQAMQYLGDCFDGYYMQREWNRDFEKINELSDWCTKHGKTLKMLANSGCLYTCPFHIFHDNLVAHETGACKLDNAMSSNPSPCWDMMENLNQMEAAAVFLQESWVRPEDICKYENYFSEVKLASRMHSNPRRVVNAYVKGSFKGNMFDLTEPSYSKRFKAYILDATRFPKDWFERTANCTKKCEECGYCANVARDMMIKKADLEKMYMSDFS